MGLDSVELVLAIEDEFGIDIPNEAAASMYTVGDVFDYLKHNVNVKTSSVCSSQKCFHRLRQAIADTYGLSRKYIKLDNKLIDFMPLKDVREGWPYLQLYTYLRIPKDSRMKIFSGQQASETLTIRELVESVLALNAEILLPDVGSEEEVWVRLVDVIRRQTNADWSLITREASFVKDLGID